MRLFWILQVLVEKLGRMLAVGGDAAHFGGRHRRHIRADFWRKNFATAAASSRSSSERVRPIRLVEALALELAPDRAADQPAVPGDIDSRIEFHGFSLGLPNLLPGFSPPDGRPASCTSAVDHELDQILELGLGLPAQLPFGLAAIADQQIHLGRAIIAGVDLDVFFQSSPTWPKATSRNSRTECVSPVAMT